VKKRKLFLWLFLVGIVLLIFANILVMHKFSLVKSTFKASSAQGTIQLIVESTVTPSPAPSPTTGGGGGGAVTPSKMNFAVDKSIIDVMMRQGESFKTSLKITNTETAKQNFEISVSESLSDSILVSDTLFSLEGGEEKLVDLTFVSIGMNAGVYTGRLKIKGQERTKEIPVIFTIKSKKVLFDMSLDIPAKYKEIYPGEELFLQSTLFNLGQIGKVDVTIEYIIKDFDGNIILKQSEIIAVETQVSFSKTIKLPSDIEPGDYVAISQARYDASVGSSSVMFHVLGAKEIDTSLLLIITVIAGAVLLIILFMRYEIRKLKGRKHITIVKKIVKKGGRGGGFAENLKSKLFALDKAYSSGFISKSSYKKGKGRITKHIKKKYL